MLRKLEWTRLSKIDTRNKDERGPTVMIRQKVKETRSLNTEEGDW